MLFLLSNDDGIGAPGLAALERALSPMGNCLVVAPLLEQSASSHAFTMHRPLRVHRIRQGWYAVDGTPVDSVYMGLHRLCSKPPALVVSGINRGANLSNDVLYSGTIAAAMEAAMWGIPSLAASILVDWSVPPDDHHWDSAAHFVRLAVRRLLERPLPQGVMLNLNVPDLPRDRVKGLRVAPLGQRTYSARVEKRLDPWGRPYYWSGGAHLGFSGDSSSDGPLVEDGWAVITPLRLNWTAHGSLARLRDQGWECDGACPESD